MKSGSIVKGALGALAGAGLTLGLAGCGGDDSAAPSGPAPQVNLPNFTDLVAHAGPAVVNISISAASQPAADDRNRPMPDMPFGELEEWFKRFFDQMPGQPGQAPPQQMPRQSQGSGFIISEDGYILTNAHVVGQGGDVVVKLSDRRELVAEVVGLDRHSDVALIKVEADDLPVVEIGDPDNLKVGAWVLAIGSPFGFETSVTAGIVSAKGRNLAGDQYVPFLQTDVAINPGNSGGPLFNLSGEVVGINSQIYSRTGGYQGVSFAIPIDVAMSVVKQLRESGSVSRGWLGVQIQEVTRELAESFDMDKPEGALVAQVLPDSPALKAGVKQGDIIIEFNDSAVESAAGLPPLVGSVPPGDEVELVVLRDGKRKSLDVEISRLETDDMAAVPAQEQPGTDVLGLQFRDLTDDERDSAGVDRGAVVITEVGPGPGFSAGLRPGDIVMAVGSKPVQNARALTRTLRNADSTVALLVRRDGTPLFVALDPSGK
ncbi:MAG: serine peptidase [Salinisphaeraceae bacterium]|nr:serine peptidase [Salinisphaeraceae bacterium]